MNRRTFVQVIGGAASTRALTHAASTPVVISSDVDSGPVRWAIGELESAIKSRGISATTVQHVSQAGAGALVIAAAQSHDRSTPEGVALKVSGG